MPPKSYRLHLAGKTKQESSVASEPLFTQYVLGSKSALKLELRYCSPSPEDTLE
jgi:hypothetical protein